MSSRLLFRNLPNYVTDKELAVFLRKSLPQLSATITDLKVLTRNGKSRKLAFVGVQTQELAEKVKKHFDKTFFDTAKLSVEFALPVNDSKLLHRKEKKLPIKKAEVDKPKVVKREPLTKSAIKGGFFSDDDEDEEKNYGGNNNQPRAEESKAKEPKKLTIPRLFFRNLNYETSEHDLRTIFSPFGEVKEILVVKDSTGKSKGFGFVEFIHIQHAIQAQNELDGSIFQGRLLHLLPADENKSTIERQNVASEPSSLYKKEAEQKQKQEAENAINWNALFIRSDAALHQMAAASQGLSKLDLVTNPELFAERIKDPGFEITNSAAVNLALVEAQMIRDTKDFLVQNGVDLEALEIGIKNPFTIPRSKTTILVKNLPNDADAFELKQMFAKFAFSHSSQLERFLFPPISKSMALVSYFSEEEARTAFQSLAYKRYKRVPLFLEYAPSNTMGSPAANQMQKIVDAPQTASFEAHDKTVQMTSNSRTVFVKNLNFSTTELDLTNHIKSLAGIEPRHVAISKTKRGEEMLSRGFGFIEMEDEKQAKVVVRQLNQTMLDDHLLELSVSVSETNNSSLLKKRQNTVMRKSAQVEKSTDGDLNKLSSGQVKILVKNLAFEATKSDIQKLFSAHGEVFSVRMPKGFTQQSRGFCFVTFTSHNEAQNAIEALNGAHLYGRKLILDWAISDIANSKNGVHNLGELKRKANESKDMHETISHEKEKRRKKGL